MQMAKCDRWALERMNVPERLWNATYAQLPACLQKPVLRYASDISSLLARGAGFFLYGESGMGKTGAGAVLLKAAWERYKTGYFISVKDLRQSIRDELTFDGHDSVMERCRAVDVLVLDDLAADDFRNFTFGIGDVEHLLTSRSVRAKTTVLTTRMTPDLIRQAGAASFLAALNGNFLSVNVQGANFKDAASAELRKQLGVG